MARLARSIPNLPAATLKRVVLSPADLERLNVNLVGGDIYGGSCALDQNLLWRPLAAAPGHATAVRGLFHIGASTHPGPGWVLAPMWNRPSTAVRWPGAAASGRQRKFWSSAHEPP